MLHARPELAALQRTCCSTSLGLWNPWQQQMTLLPTPTMSMKVALAEYEIIGCTTTIPFCEYTLNHPAFTSGKYDTHFVSQYFEKDFLCYEIGRKMERKYGSHRNVSDKVQTI